MSDFLESAPCAPAVFYRSYSRRKDDGTRESFTEAVTRAVNGIAEVGSFTEEQRELCLEAALQQQAFPSGRALWVSGTDWSRQPENFYGFYNCQSSFIDEPAQFGLLMELAMCGTGTGAVLQQDVVGKLPPIKHKLVLGTVKEDPDSDGGQESTGIEFTHPTSVDITVGDSRQGWVDAYQGLINIAMGLLEVGGEEDEPVFVNIDLTHVRGAGNRLKGFGGVSNPIKLRSTLERVTTLLGKAHGRKLTPIEACLLIDEAASAVVAGSIRRAAGMRQFSEHDEEAAIAKLGLYKQDEDGNWSVDPEREALRMANHTRTWHHKPTYQEILDAVTLQHGSGEGAIQYVPEAIARANADLLDDPGKKKHFLKLYNRSDKTAATNYIRTLAKEVGEPTNDRIIHHRMHRYGLNPCLIPGTMVMTRQGHFPIESLVGREVEVFDGVRWVKIDNFRVTGTDQPVVRVELHCGISYTVTPYHAFILEDGTRIEARDLQPGMQLKSTEKRVNGKVHANGAYLKGFLVGDGTYNKSQFTPVCKVYEPKHVCVDRLVESQREIGVKKYVARSGRVTGERFGLSDAGYLLNLGKSLEEDLSPWVSVYKKEFPKEVYNWTRQCQLDFIAGLFDADGTTLDSKNGYGYQIVSISREFLEGLGLLLHDIGIRFRISPPRPARYHDLGHRGGVCLNKESHRLSIGQAGAIKLAGLVEFTRLKDLSDRRCAYNMRYKGLKVSAVTDAGIAPAVYCCTVPTNNSFTLTGGIVSGQCAEILLCDNVCNLGDVHLNRIEPSDQPAQDRAFRAAALQVAGLLHHHFPSERLQYSRENDPIVGVSFTGLFDFFVTAFGESWLQWMMDGRPAKQGRAFVEAERQYLTHWRNIVGDEVRSYCLSQGIRIPNRYTTVQPAGCLDRTALRVFDQGLLYADDLLEPGSGETEVSGLSVRGGISAETGIANQPMELIRVTLKNKRVLRLTPDHRLLLESGEWCRAEDLAPGSRIQHSLGEYRNTSEAALIPVEAFAYTREARRESAGHSLGLLSVGISTPATMSPDLAYFLGALFGNGSMSERCHRIRFSMPAGSAVTIRLREVASKLFGLAGTIRDEERTTEFCLASRQLWDWMHLNGFEKGKSKELERVPLAIRVSSRESVLGFIAGLIDTDGCVRTKGHFSIDMASEAFIRNLQQIAEAVGIGCTVSHNTQGQSLQEEKDMWSLVMSRAATLPESRDFLNKFSEKCRARPLRSAKMTHSSYAPFTVSSVERDPEPDYTYDFSVSGVDDDDSWYFQGAIVSHNSKSLLTGASPGWHPPKAQRFIRRITFSKTDPIVGALKDYGYSVIPAQSARDDEGRLLDDVNDPRVHEVLVEIPVEVPWARLEGCDRHDLSRLPIEAQWGLYMQVQRHYSTHTTSATLEIRESEIETLAKLIHQDIQQDGGYMSAALLARFDDSQTFPRMPFEPIDLETYERLHQEVLDRRITDDIGLALSIHDDPAYNVTQQDGACTNGACVFKADLDEARGVS